MHPRALVAAGVLVVLGCSHSPPLPPKAIALNQAGAYALAKGDLETAEARLALAVEYNPRFTEAWVNLGLVELRRGNAALARRHLEKARSLNDDLPTPHHALGYLEDALGNGEAAEKHYRAALKVDPGFAAARINLGRRLFRRHAYDEAREQFLRLTQVAPEMVEGWVGLTESFLALHRGAEAAVVLANAKKRFPETPALLLLVARVMMEKQQLLEAEALLALLTDGRLEDDVAREASAFAWLAVTRVTLGRPREGVAAAREALQRDPREGVAVVVMARALRILGDPEAESWEQRAASPEAGP
jgi:tetratricopeptide (TPR) repeat protein